MAAAPATAPATYTVAAACRRLRVSPAAYRRGWAGVFTRQTTAAGRVALRADEVEHAAQFAGDRDRMVGAVLRFRRDTGRLSN